MLLNSSSWLLESLTSWFLWSSNRSMNHQWIKIAFLPLSVYVNIHTYIHVYKKKKRKTVLNYQCLQIFDIDFQHCAKESNGFCGCVCSVCAMMLAGITTILSAGIITIMWWAALLAHKCVPGFTGVTSSLDLNFYSFALNRVSSTCLLWQQCMCVSRWI